MTLGLNAGANAEADANQLTLSLSGITKVSGEWWLAEITCDGGGRTISENTTADWTLVQAVTTANDHSSAVFKFLYEGSDPGLLFDVSVSENVRGRITRVIDGDATDVVEASNQNIDSTGDTDCVVDGATSSGADRLAVYWALCDRDTTPTAPGTLTQLYSDDATLAGAAGGRCAAACGYKAVGAGASGTETFTQSNSFQSSGIVVILKPAAGGGGGVELVDRGVGRGIGRGIMRKAA